MVSASIFLAMIIGNTRFWKDDDRASWLAIRSANRLNYTHPMEFDISKRCGLLDFEIYEDESESGGTEYRLSAAFLWLRVNILVWLNPRGDVRRWDDSARSWGWYFLDRSFVARWAKRYWSFQIPFITTVFVRHDLMRLDRSEVVVNLDERFKDDFKKFDAIEEKRKQHSATFPYRYELARGGHQDVNATICIERWVRCWKWTPFLSIEDSIDVKFDDEVGPKRGSWKGGCIGCSYTMKRGETAIQCLRRMERERRFE